jgi:hypothetical protein
MDNIRNELKAVIDVIRQAPNYLRYTFSGAPRMIFAHTGGASCMPPILHACWGAFAGSFRSVSLEIPIELLKDVAPKFSRTSAA